MAKVTHALLLPSHCLWATPFNAFFFFLLAVILSLYPSYHRVSMFLIVFASVCLSVCLCLSLP